MLPPSPATSTTWLLVRIRPSAVRMMPDPEPEPSAPETSICTTRRQHLRGDGLDRAVGGVGRGRGRRLAGGCVPTRSGESSCVASHSAAPADAGAAADDERGRDHAGREPRRALRGRRWSRRSRRRAGASATEGDGGACAGAVGIWVMRPRSEPRCEDPESPLGTAMKVGTLRSRTPRCRRAAASLV